MLTKFLSTKCNTFSIIGCLDIREKPNVLFICTPNNPSGHFFSADFILKLATEFKNMHIILDLTYAFFEHNFTEYLKLIKQRKANIISIISYSKFFCLPGLRIGSVFFGQDALMNRAREIMGPLRISILSEKLLPQLLEDKQYIADLKKFFTTEWPIFLSHLNDKINWLIPSGFSACFKLFYIKPNSGGNISPLELTENLIKNYGIRVCPGNTYGINNAIRIRIGKREDNYRLITALSKLGKI